MAESDADLQHIFALIRLQAHGRLHHANLGENVPWKILGEDFRLLWEGRFVL